jgi:hypothetical protein
VFLQKRLKFTQLGLCPGRPQAFAAGNLGAYVQFVLQLFDRVRHRVVAVLSVGPPVTAVLDKTYQRLAGVVQAVEAIEQQRQGRCERLFRCCRCLRKQCIPGLTDY